MKRNALLLTVLILSSWLYSQEMKLYAPFPSRIKAETSGAQVLITWKDSGDVEGGNYEVYRGDTALTADNLYLAEKIGETSAGIENYRDTPPTGTEFYYAVFVRDEAQVYKICIPYRNVTTSPVSVEESDIEETISTVISGITAEVFEDDVSITYESSLEERNVLLFRSTVPINTYEQLIKSVIVNEDTGSERGYLDNPMAGLEYYYAAVDGDLYRTGSEKLLYAGNFTTFPVHVKFSHEIQEENRYIKSAMPLPLLKISTDLKSGDLLEEREDPEEETRISSGTLRDVRRLIDRSRLPYEPVEATTLAYNRNINSIVTSYFAAGIWDQCIDRLEEYTTLRYDEETRQQSHFYRGQAYFFSGLYNKAMLEFIMVEEDFFVETRPFFDAIYSLKRTS